MTMAMLRWFKKKFRNPLDGCVAPSPVGRRPGIARKFKLFKSQVRGWLSHLCWSGLRPRVQTAKHCVQTGHKISWLDTYLSLSRQNPVPSADRPSRIAKHATTTNSNNQDCVRIVAILLLFVHCLSLHLYIYVTSITLRMNPKALVLLPGRFIAHGQ
jgi:hypothetical protein